MVHLRLPRLLVIAVACCTFPSLAGALPMPLGDAGTGMDAGNDESAALALEYGAYEGNLTPRDSDWYAFGGAGLGCVDVAAMASSPMSFGVATDGGSAHGVAHEGAFDVVVATAGPVRFAVLPDELPWSAASVGPYSFALSRAAPWAVGDRRHADAPASTVGAAPVPGECFEALFRHDGPDVDVWTFEAKELDIVTYSFAVGHTAVGELRILAPDGTTVGPTIGSGGLGQFIAMSEGTYAVRAASLTSTDSSGYIVGLTVGPDPSTCRPYCFGIE